MATQYIKVRGKAFWAQVFEQNRDMEGWDGTAKEWNGQYLINVALEGDSLMDLTASGSQAVDHMKEVVGEDGTVYKVVRFKRRHEHRNRKGELMEWASGAPKVVKDDGSPWVLEDDGLIGNTSDVECTVAVYDAGKNKGTRLQEVRILNHVPAPEKVSA